MQGQSLCVSTDSQAPAETEDPYYAIASLLSYRRRHLVPEKDFVFFVKLHNSSVAEPLQECKCLDFSCHYLPIASGLLGHS